MCQRQNDRISDSNQAPHQNPPVDRQPWQWCHCLCKDRGLHRRWDIRFLNSVAPVHQAKVRYPSHWPVLIVPQLSLRLQRSCGHEGMFVAIVSSVLRPAPYIFVTAVRRFRRCQMTALRSIPPTGVTWRTIRQGIPMRAETGFWNPPAENGQVVRSPGMSHEQQLAQGGQNQDFPGHSSI